MERDPELRQYYALANRRSLSAADLDRIATHQSTAYLIGPGGTLEGAQDMLQAGAALLDAGGFAVKVGNSRHGAFAPRLAGTGRTPRNARRGALHRLRRTGEPI